MNTTKRTCINYSYISDHSIHRNLFLFPFSSFLCSLLRVFLTVPHYLLSLTARYLRGSRLQGSVPSQIRSWAVFIVPYLLDGSELAGISVPLLAQLRWKSSRHEPGLRTCNRFRGVRRTSFNWRKTVCKGICPRRSSCLIRIRSK